MSPDKQSEEWKQHLEGKHQILSEWSLIVTSLHDIMSQKTVIEIVLFRAEVFTESFHY
jgi:hypothetical protein